MRRRLCGLVSLLLALALAPAPGAQAAPLTVNDVSDSRTGGWGDGGDGGYNFSHHYESPPNQAPGAATATWNFTGLAAGSYDLLATWKEDPLDTPVARYEVRVNGVPQTSSVLDQRVQASGLFAAMSVPNTKDALFAYVGSPVSVSGPADTISVVLSDTDAGSTYLDADAAAIQPAAPRNVHIIDDGGRGFATNIVYTWTDASCYIRDIRFTDTLGQYATWTFDSLPAGNYKVYATWVVGNSDPTAPYSVYDGTDAGTLLGTTLCNQSAAPPDLNIDGANWDQLDVGAAGPDSSFAITSGTLTVKLVNDGTGRIIADAVRIEYLGGAPPSGGGGIPEPAGLGLIGLALFALRKKRNKGMTNVAEGRRTGMFKKMLCGLLVAASAVAVAAAFCGPARADVIDDFTNASVNIGPPVRTDNVLLGQLDYLGYDGAMGWWDKDNTRNTGVGFMLPGLSAVQSFSIDQINDASRSRFKDVIVHTGVGTTTPFTFADSQAPQTITFPSPVTTDYIYVECTSCYLANNWVGMAEVIVNGSTPTPRQNLNRLPGATASDNAGWYSLTETDDKVRAAEGNGPWWVTGGTDWMRVAYPSPQTVGEIGIGLLIGTRGDACQPQWITLSYDGGSELFYLTYAEQYTRFALSAPVSTTFLQVDFPTATADFWDGNRPYFGVTEFQAYAPLQTPPPPGGGGIPEPAGLGLIGLALVALSRSRNRRTTRESKERRTAMLKKMLCGLLVAASVFALSGALSGPARADVVDDFTNATVNIGPPVRTDNVLLGQWSWIGANGALGWHDSTATYHHGIGFMLPGLSNLTSFTVDQADEGSRSRFKDIIVHTGVGTTAAFSFPDDSQVPRTFTFASPVTTDYIYVQCTSFYAYSDSLVGVNEVIVNGTAPTPRPNLNRLPGATPSDNANYYSGTETDDKVRSADGTGPFWTPGGSDWMTVTYPSAQTVGEIGIGLQFDRSDRCQPKWFTLSYAGGSQTFDLTYAQQYTRFALTDPVSTTFLRVDFPSDTAEFWGQLTYYGVSEFQAYEPLPSENGGGGIPEPAGLGSIGLALLAARRRRS